MRGLKKVKQEGKLWALAYNVLQWIRLGWKKLTNPPEQLAPASPRLAVSGGFRSTPCPCPSRGAGLSVRRSAPRPLWRAIYPVGLKELGGRIAPFGSGASGSPEAFRFEVQ